MLYILYAWLVVRFTGLVVLCWKLKTLRLVLVIIFLKQDSLCGKAISSFQLGQVDRTVDNFHHSWPSQKVVYDKIILKELRPVLTFQRKIFLLNLIDFPYLYVNQTYPIFITSK